jgi:hypothetical protein
MDVPGLVWALTILGILALLLFDFCFHVRTAHTQAAIWSGAYVGSAVFLATTAVARLGAPGRATSPRGTWSRGARVRNG